MSLDLQVLQLLRLVSPALPVGAFAYSQGLEGAIEQAWIKDEQDSLEWISNVLQNSISSLDLPALYWQMQHIQLGNEDPDKGISEFIAFNDYIYAYRETSEFRLESHQMGQALLRLLRDTTHTTTQAMTQTTTPDFVDKNVHSLLYESEFEHIDWVSAFAIAASSVKLNTQQAMLGYAWAWCETQVAAAIKLVPLGQTQGQKMLITLIEIIAQVIDQRLNTMPKKEEIGAISPNLAIISSLHETQYSRLFRS